MIWYDKSQETQKVVKKSNFNSDEITIKSSLLTTANFAIQQQVIKFIW